MCSNVATIFLATSSVRYYIYTLSWTITYYLILYIVTTCHMMWTKRTQSRLIDRVRKHLHFSTQRKSIACNASCRPEVYTPIGNTRFHVLKRQIPFSYKRWFSQCERVIHISTILNYIEWKPFSLTYVCGQ